MFQPSRIHHQSCQGTACRVFLHDDFGVLCWNVYKNNLIQPAFQPYLRSLIERKKIDLLLFQEANFKSDESCILSEFAIDAAANLEFGGKFYGVLTASMTESRRSQAFLSQGRESLIGPYKSLLLSQFAFKDGTTLLVLNIHAINFRENQGYDIEVDEFLEYVKDHHGPMIIAGDFNSWNKKRLKKLREMQKKLSLKAISFSEKNKIKSFMGYPLDYIFYRGLELLDSAVIDSKQLSDHNPLFARFKKK
jgi:endonuclease/exonuclease/phosphatase (EEP) superfamily protein YafD